MKDSIRFTKPIKDIEAFGCVCIDYLDPITNKIKERIIGENHVYKDSLFTSNEGNWKAALTTSYLSMIMTDDISPVEVDFPYIKGNTIGYGTINAGSSGLLRGAWNAANSYLDVVDLTKSAWKFSFDFTPSQALGTIKSIGLTNQYGRFAKNHYSRLTTPSYSYTISHISDGRYSYLINTSGIITKHDVILGTDQTIDVSAITGDITAEPKYIGYDDVNKLYYVSVYSSTPANRKIYKFSNNSFSTLLNTYLCTAMTSQASQAIFGVYGNMAFFRSGASVIKYNFVDNSAPTSVSVPSIADRMNVAYELGNNNQASFQPFPTTFMIYGKYILGYGYRISTNYYSGLIYDMAIEEWVAEASLTTLTNGKYWNHYVHPFTTDKLPFLSDDVYNGAIAQYKVPVDAPARPDGYGMSITYELEVYW